MDLQHQDPIFSVTTRHGDNETRLQVFADPGGARFYVDCHQVSLSWDMVDKLRSALYAADSADQARIINSVRGS